VQRWFDLFGLPSANHKLLRLLLADGHPKMVSKASISHEATLKKANTRRAEPSLAVKLNIEWTLFDRLMQKQKLVTQHSREAE